eukprot:g58412.t1
MSSPVRFPFPSSGFARRPLSSLQLPSSPRSFFQYVSPNVFCSNHAASRSPSSSFFLSLPAAPSASPHNLSSHSTPRLPAPRPPASPSLHFTWDRSPFRHHTSPVLSRICWSALAEAQAAEFAAWRSKGPAAREATLRARAKQRLIFRSGLSPHQRACFDSLSRLSRHERLETLAKLDEATIRSRGLHWADEAVPEAPSPAEIAATLSIPSPEEVADRSALEAIALDCWAATDPLFLDLALHGLRSGANICFEGPRVGSLILSNYASAFSNRDFVSAELDEEQRRGWLCQWFPSPPLPNARVPPIGTVSKDGSFLRLTVDLSAGGPRSTNASTPKLFTDFVQWKSLAGALRVAHAGSKQGSGRLPFLLKLDVAKAFRKVPIRLADLHLTILEWEGRPIRWVDDYLLVALCSRDEASELSSLLAFLSARYGFEFKLEKLEGPCHALTFIGWSFDLSPSLEEPTVSIPPGKKERFAHSAVATLSCPSRSGLDKLLGKLFNFATVFPVLRPAALRVSSHRHSLPESGPAKHIPFPLPAEIKEDIVWAADAVASLPPTSVIQRCYEPSDLSQSSADIWIKSDAGSSFGQGFVVLKGPWLSDSAIDWGYRPHSVTEREAAFGKISLCSAVLEAFVPSTAARALSHKLAGRSVFFELDNEAAVLCLKTGAANSPALDTAVKAARAAFSALGCIVRFSHIPRSLNSLADALSKDNVTLFLKQARSEGLFPSQLPVLAPAISPTNSSPPS